MRGHTCRCQRASVGIGLSSQPMCCVSLCMPGKWASELMRILLPIGSGDGNSGPHNRTGSLLTEQSSQPKCLRPSWNVLGNTISICKPIQRVWECPQHDRSSYENLTANCTVKSWLPSALTQKEGKTVHPSHRCSTLYLGCLSNPTKQFLLIKVSSVGFHHNIVIYKNFFF